MIKKCCISTLLSVGIWFFANPLFAQLNIPDSSGFAGYATVLPGYIVGTTSQFAEGAPALGEISDQKVNSIFERPGQKSTGMLGAGGEINYTFGKSRTQLFLGNRFEDLLRLDVVFGVGIRQELKDSSIIALSLLYTPTRLKVWSDPYIENQERRRTALAFPGMRFRWGRMFGSELEITATARFYRLDDENSGDWLVTQNRLDVDELGKLDRNGIGYRLQALYLFSFGKHNFLPAFRYRIDNHDGKAIANQGYLTKFTYLYRTKRIILDINAGYGQVWAQEENPIYQSTLESNRYVFGLTAIAPVKLFKSSVLSLMFYSEYYSENANIDFYDSSFGVVSLGVIWKTLRI